MIGHYLKIAWRNLLKYRTQTAINIVGLAVGFACFALATMWIRYELTYDDYHEGADRLYVAYRTSLTRASGYDLRVEGLVPLLREQYPEVEAACGMDFYPSDLTDSEGAEVPVYRMTCDSTFLRLLNIRLLKGSMDFMHVREHIALTPSLALRLFGTTDVIGRKVEGFSMGTYTVCALVSELPHSAFRFDFCGGYGEFDYKESSSVLIRLRPGSDIESLQRKLAVYSQERDGETVFPYRDLHWIPLRSFHYSDMNEQKAVGFTYLVLFSAIGLLVIAATLFNYLSLFVVRMRIRNREVWLRRVHGSSRRSLFCLFATEYTGMVLPAGVVGMALVELVFPAFRAMSGIEGSVYAESAVYFLLVLLLSWLMLLPFVLHVGKQTASPSRLRSLGIGVQFTLSLLFIFVTAVVMKQLYYLRDTDLGWERKNVATLEVIRMPGLKEGFEAITALTDAIGRLSYVEQAIDNHWAMLAQTVLVKGEVTDWDGCNPDAGSIRMQLAQESSTFTDFYGLTLLQGHMMTPTDQQYAVVNETAARLMGMRDPVGKHLTVRGKQLEIIGLVRDFHISAPTVPVQPILLIGEDGLGLESQLRAMGFGGRHNGRILIKYSEGHYDDLRKDITRLAEEHTLTRYTLQRTEDLYAKFLQSETLLLQLLGVVALVCIIVSAFGIFSMVTLSCERRRKEVAIRKVNGARVGDILALFAREYLLLLVIASAVAFPVGYVLMKRWLENYVEQTPISAWIYIVIFAGMAVLIALCIGWRVWRAANENPAEVVKSE